MQILVRTEKNDARWQLWTIRFYYNVTSVTSHDYELLQALVWQCMIQLRRTSWSIGKS